MLGAARDLIKFLSRLRFEHRRRNQIAEHGVAAIAQLQVRHEGRWRGGVGAGVRAVTGVGGVAVPAFDGADAPDVVDGAASDFGAEGVEGVVGAAGAFAAGGAPTFDVDSAAHACHGDITPNAAHAARTARCSARVRPRMRYAGDRRKAAREAGPMTARRDANTITTAFSKGRSGTTVACPV
ncbi:hypothetical protein PPGU19_000530 [Paraburkholderia sp. PGU19]|nr:hypothetical protein PPGU19_000530 [Paraburkholderia sp. PGU19]